MKLKYANKALEDFTLALEIKSDLSQAYLNRALAFKSLDKFEEAAKDFIDYLFLVSEDAKYVKQIKAWLKKNDFPFEIEKE
jgi:tetratricopeptide (TPR) repeat protein